MHGDTVKFTSVIDMLSIFAFMETEYSTASSVEPNTANTPE
jgi:hypothetical protein